MNDELNEIFYSLKIAEALLEPDADLIFYLASKIEVSNLLSQIDNQKIYLKEKFELRHSPNTVLHFVYFQ